jgi:hypothetical protein
MSALMTISRRKPDTRESAVKPPTEKNCLNTSRLLSRLRSGGKDKAAKNLALRQDFSRKFGPHCRLLLIRAAGNFAGAARAL